MWNPTTTITFVLGVLAALTVLACGNSPKGVCDDTCDKNFDCKLNSVTSEDAWELCRARCIPQALELRQMVDDGRLTAECLDARLDYEDCRNGLECSQLRREAIGSCDDRAEARENACSESRKH